MAATIEKNGDVLEIEFTGRWSQIADAKEKVKDIAGRQWHPELGEKGRWTVPADPVVADRLLRTIQPTVSEELMQWIRESMVSHEESLTTPLPDDAKLLVPWGHTRMPWQPAVVNDENFNGALPYQRAAIDRMAANGRALLCDDMGLGKTFEAITAVEEWTLRNMLPDLVTVPTGPRLVIAPGAVLGGWDRELTRWLDEPNIQIVDSKTPDKRHTQIQQAIKDEAWTIINWEQLRIKRITAKTKNGGKRNAKVMKEPLFQYPQAHEWDVPLADWDLPAYAKAERMYGKADPYWLSVIADEIHRAKNKDSQQTQGLHRTRGQVMYGLTGTPIMNSPDELWALLRWLWPHQYHERGAAYSEGAVAFWDFYNMHVEFWEDHFKRKVVTGVKNPDALRYALKDKLIRRTQAILGLKGRYRMFYEVPMTTKQKAIYDEAERSMWIAIQEDVVAGNQDAIKLARLAAEGGSFAELMKIPNGAARFVRLQQILENAKLVGGPDESANMDDFEQKFADSRPHQWVVFCLFKSSCDILAERLRKKHGDDVKVGVYYGDVDNADRTKLEDAFQRGELDVLVGTIAAMREGITLTRGHLQHWLSRAVVPAWNEQGESRNDRLGQQERVLVYVPQAPDTVSTDTVHVINRLKEGIVRTVIPQDKIEESENE